mgnify:CR=1 FL=1
MTDGPAGSAESSDVELASACLAGDERAWERLIREYKPALLRAAQALDPAGGAHDLAEELFADLFSKSLLRYYQGRSSLLTWLRAVLAQRFVDRIRARRRLGDPVDERLAAPQRRVEPGEAACRGCVRAALESAVAALDPGDRLLVRLYYDQGLTLTAIGRLRHESEATASRHLSRIRATLRRLVESGLAAALTGTGLSTAECLRLVMDDAGDLDLQALLASSDGPTVHNERGSRGD